MRAVPGDVDDEEPISNGPRIIAIGGGKGGVGKSVIAANVGLAIAGSGRRVVLVDADLGGANLHTMLGMRNPARSLSDFVARRVDTLEEVLLPTSEERLLLLSGARALLDAANPKYAQKMKILRHLGSLPADWLVLDLGAGSGFNVLDFFLAADAPVLVVTPEATAVENGYQVLKAAFFRHLKGVRPRERVRPALERVAAERRRRGITSARELVDAVGELDQEAGEALRRAAERFTPRVLVNRAETHAHRRLADDIATASRDYFGTRVASAGHLPGDACVPRSVSARRPALALFPRAAFSLAVDDLAERLMTGTCDD